MVKCAECGFLAVREFDTRKLVEAEDWIRTWGEERPTGGPKKRYDDEPVCIMGKVNFYREANNRHP